MVGQCVQIDRLGEALEEVRPAGLAVPAGSSSAKRRDINRAWPVVLQTPCRRLTRLTSGPIKVKSSRWP
jgi:hypothetical protein